jgi:hypothetical protein
VLLKVTSADSAVPQALQAVCVRVLACMVVIAFTGVFTCVVVVVLGVD